MERTLRIISGEVRNFGSYSQLGFKFTDLGLTLISGPTGAGKSTLQDIIPWVLFGVTSKNGKVDDVLSWTTDEETIGTLKVDGIEIIRIRGNGKNDLYWWDFIGEKRRGKDITETQKLLEERLGVSSELYLTAACFNEFSKTGNFFTNSAKDRRQLFETIANLNLATQISTKVKNEQKTIKISQQAANRKSDAIEGSINGLRQSRTSLTSSESSYDVQKATRRASLLDRSRLHDDKQAKDREVQEQKIKSWDANRDEQLAEYKIRRLDLIEEKDELVGSACPTCGEPNRHYSDLAQKIRELSDGLNRLRSSISPYRDVWTYVNNPYPNLIEDLDKETNPFAAQISRVDEYIYDNENELKITKDLLSTLQLKSTDLYNLHDNCQMFRGELLKQVIYDIQDSTNERLENHFDGEIRITFKVEADDLDISVQKNGYECSYSQLSRGQRSMLKLCFSVSVMEAAANRAGIHFNVLCFDEVLDGLSSELKIKALGIFQELELSHESILVTDHAPELFSHFTRRFNVTLQNDCSIVEEA